MKRLTTNYYGCNQIIDCKNDMCYETCERYKDCTECPIKRAIDKLADYEDAEEQGLLLRLPCRPGDFLYQLDKQTGNITLRQVSKIDFEIMGEKSHTMQIWFTNAGFCFKSHFGKTIFKNKADALHALAEYQSRNET